MKKTLFCLLCCMSIGWCLTVKAYAEDVITVVTENWAPYNFEENGAVKGISTEIVKKVLDNAKIKYTIDVYPWARAYKMAEEEKNVLIFTIVKTPERENKFKWVRAIAEPDSTYLFKLSERKEIIVNSLDDAKKYQTGVIRESMYHQFLLKNGFQENTNLQAVASMEQNYKKLVMKRIDLWAEGEKNMQDEIKKQSTPNQDIRVEKAFLLFKYPYYMAFSKQTSDEIVEKVKASFDQLANEGVIKKNE